MQSKKNQPKKNSTIQFETLEQRLLFSADFQGITFQDNLEENYIQQEQMQYQPVEYTPLNPSSQGTVYERHEIVFIDDSIENYETLIEDMQKQNDENVFVEYVLISGEENGIEQITNFMSEYQDIDAVHILSHGEQGKMYLGNTEISLENVNQHTSQLLQWQQFLNDNADVNFYGCDLAGNEEGKTLIRTISALSGADIAASTDLTGSSLLGGDWELEYTVGEIENSLDLQSADLIWTGTLSSTPIGSEFQINTTTSDIQEVGWESQDSVAIDDQGNFVVVWASNNQDGSGWGVYAQRFNASGVAQGSEFQVNTTTSGNQFHASVAMDANGDFVVVWDNDLEVYAQRFDANGNALGSEFQVNTLSSGAQKFADVAMADNGDFVIVYQSWNFDGSDFGIAGQRYDSAGVAQGSEFQINSSTLSSQEYPDVAMDSSGNFIVTWSDSDNGYGVNAQRFDSSGNTLGSEFYVNTTTAGDQKFSQVAIDGSGNFVIVWQSYDQDGSLWGIYGQRYDSSGVAQGSEFLINTTTAGEQEDPNIAMDHDGYFTVTWTDDNGLDGNLEGIFAQDFDPNGNKIGSEYLVNTNITGDQDRSGIAMNAAGKFVVVWSGQGPGDTTGIFAQRYENTNINTLPTAANNTVGTNEDVSYTFTASDFNFSDGDGDSLTQIQITALPGAGSLRLNGSAVSLNQVIAIADINAGNLKFIPATNANGTNYANFNFKVYDGKEYSASAYTMTVDVTAVNDAPTSAHNSVFFNENTTYTFSLSDFKYSDIEGDTFTQIQITSLESVGSLELSGVAVTLNQIISAADISAGNLKFVPAANESGVFYDNFQFKVHDGTQFSTSPYRIDVNVLADDAYLIDFNDIPEGAFLDTEYYAQYGITISGTRLSGSPDVVTTLNTDGSVSPDNDFEGPWAGGNLVGQSSNNAMILAKNATDSNSDGIIDVPNVAVYGDMYIDFENPIQSFGADYIDVEHQSEADNTNVKFIEVNLDYDAQNLIDTTNALNPIMYLDLLDSSGNTANDLTANNHDGTHIGHVAQLEGALYKDSFYTEINHSSQMELTEGTVSLWFKIDDLNSLQTLFSKDSSGYDTGGHLTAQVLTDGSLQIRHQTTSTSHYIQSTTGAVSADQWYHVTYSWGANGQELYLNDTLVDSDPAVLSLIGNQEPLVLGASTMVSGNLTATPVEEFFNGKMAEFSLFGTQLNSTDINNLYSAGSGTVGTHVTVVSVPLGEFSNPASQYYDSTVVWGHHTANRVSPITATSLGLNHIDQIAFEINGRIGIDNLNVSFNKAPTATDNTVVTNEDTTYTFTVNDFNFSDVENDSLRKIQITSLESVGSLELDGVAVTLNQEISRADILAGKLKFIPLADGNGSGYDSFQFKVNDGNLFSANARTMTIDVIAVNDIPTAGNNTVVTNEDIAYTFTASDFNFTDVDGDSLNQIQITSLPGAGSLELNGVAVSLNQVISIADINAGNLKFVPAANVSGTNYANFNFKVHDGTVYSTSAYTMTIDVTAVNDPPTASNNTVVTNEDTAYTFTASDFNFSDIEGDSLTQIQITALPGAGSLELNGVAISLNQVIAMADINAGNLKFVPAANANGSNYTSFNFKVNDGTNYSVTAYTMTIDITAVNDIPTASNNTVVTNEDTTYTFTASDFNFSDVDGDSLTQIQITALPGAGSLELNGVAVSLNQVITIADINAGNLKFVPAANANGTNYANFAFKVHDGTVYSASAYTMTVDVTAVNDAPTASDNTVVTNEDTAYTFTASDFNFNDIDGDSLSQVQITGLPGAGSLELNGVAVSLNQAISIADINAGNLKFVPADNANGTGYATFAFKVHDGTAYSDSVSIMTVDVTAVNDAPTATNNTVVTNEDTAYTFTASDFNFSDIDGDSLTQIQITALPGAGSIELNGVAVNLNQVISIADINAGNLKFVPAANANGSGYSNFAFKVHDGTAYSASAYTMTVDVTAINDAPTASNNTVVTNEDTAYTFTASDFNFSDIDGDSLTQIQITALPGAGSLELNGVAISLNQVISIADINAGNLKFVPAANANGTNYANFAFKVHDGTAYSESAYTMTVDVTAVNDAPTASDNTVVTNEDTAYTFTASDFNFNDIDGDSLTQVQITGLPGAGSLELNGVAVSLNQAISIADINAGNLKFVPAANANGTGYTTFAFKVHDGTVYSDSVSIMTVDVTAVNDAPTASNNTVVTNEDTAYTFTASDFNFSDIDGDSLTQIQITALPGAGSLELNGVGVSLNQVIAIADINAGNLKFVPAANANGTSYTNFNFKVHDGAAYSVSAYTMTVDVTAVNDAPTASNNTVTTNEDTAYTFTASDFNFSDIDGDSLTQIQITALPGVGSLELNGVAVSLNQVISIADINAGNLKFVPAANANGSGYSNFAFKVHDGTAYSASAYTMTVDVTAINDAPTASNNTVVTNEDTAYTFTASDFNFSDTDGDSLTQIQITALPGAGSLELNGVAVSLNQVISIADINAGNLKFVPAVNANGSNYANFDFKVHDGTAYSASAYTMTVDVTAINDAPTASNNTVVTNEDTAYTFTASDFNFSDTDGDPLTQIQITALPGAGSLELNGVAVSLNQVISIADIDAGNLKFVPAANANGNNYANFDFKVHDGTAYSASAYTMTVDVTAVNDAPTASNNTVVTNEDVTYTFTASDFNYSDIDGDSLTQIQITALPGAGSLELNGVAVSLNQVIAIVDINAGNLKFVPAANANGTNYANFDFKVHDGTAYSASAYTMTVDVTAVNDTPTASNNTVVTNEDTTYTFTASDFNFSDIDGDSLTQIQITALPGAGSLELNGVAVSLNQVISIADINAGNLKFVPAANANGTGYSNFAFKVHDGTAYSASAYTMTVDITAINDAPTASNNTVVTNEDTAYTFTASDFNFSDIDGDSLTQIQITALPGAGSLELNGVAVSLNQVISIADINAGNLKFVPVANANGTNYANFDFKVHDGTVYSASAYTMTVDVTAVNDTPTASNNTVVTNEDTAYTFTASDFNFSDIDGDSLTQIQITALPGAGSLELNGVAVSLNQVISIADINAGNLKFVPATNANGSNYANFDFKVHDGTAYSASAYTVTVDVTAVNDAPTAINNTVVTNEDTAYTFTASDFNFSDIEGDSLTQIQITALPGAGSLELNGVAVSLNQVITVADINAGNLKFVPAANANGTNYANFDFKVHDGAVYSASAYTMTVDVTAINDAPTATNNTVVTNEDTAYTFTASDFNLSDIDGDSLAQIQITALPGAGSLELNGVAVSLNQVITVADINAGNLKFVPAANANGTNYANFDFKVHDGTVYSASAYTMTVDVTAVNDAPTATNNTVATNEDTAYTFTASDFNFNDIDGDSLSQIQITALPGAGSLELNGVAVSLNQVISIADINAGNLKFVPAADANGSGYSNFAFKVHDGTAYSASAYTMTVDVTAINDAPTATNNSVVTNEDTAYTFTASDFNFSDIDGDSLTQIQITALPGAGSLELNGVAVSLNQIISIADINAGNLKFVPAANANGANYANFDFKVHDGTVYSSADYTITIDVDNQNDLPTASNNTVNTNEDTAYTFTASDFNFSDIDGDSLTQIQITTLPGAGSLELNGVAVSLNQVISIGDINAGNLKFVPSANANGSNYANFNFKVHDGTAYSASAYTMTVDVTAVNDAPTATNNTVATNEDTTYTFTASDFNFSDIDGDSLSQIQITALPGAGSLELNGVAVSLNQVISVADINAGNLKFVPAANANGANYASLNFKVHDGTEFSSNAYNILVNVTPVNDAPTATNNTVVTNEDTAYTFTASDFNLSDIDGDSLAQIQITALPGVGSLELNGVAVSLNQVITVADINAGNLKFVPAANANGSNYANFDFRVHDGTVYSASAYTMTVDVTAINDAPTAINNIVVTNEDTAYTFTASDFNFSDIDGDSLTQIQITALPGAGSLELNGIAVSLNQVISIADINAGNLKFVPAVNANGSNYANFDFKVYDGTAYSASAFTMTVDVTAVNDAPTASNNTVTTNEDTAYAFTASDFNFSDIDGDSLTQIQITALPGAGSLELNGVAVSLNQIISIADINAGNLKFVPAANANGANYANFDFKVHDGTIFSSADYTLTIDINNQNDLPTASNNTVNTNEDTAYTFTASDFNFSDIDGDSLTQIQITTLPGAGSLELNGVAVSLNQVISVADINAGNLKFVPATNANGSNYANFNFKVHDGTAYSASAYTMTVDVTAINDAPTASNNTVVTNEDTAYTFTASDFNFSDIEGDSFTQVQITTLPGAGTLELNGVAVSLNQVITIADINAGNLKFVPAANANGSSYANFDFRVHDGTAYSAAAYTMTVDVTAVNDAPTASNNTVITNEDTAYTLNASDFAFSDIDGDSLSQVQITALPGAGSLELNGVTVNLNQVISIADINAGNLKFVPAVNANGASYANFGFKVHDGISYSANENALDIDVLAVNDAPTAANMNQNLQELAQYTFQAGDFGFNDVDGDSLVQVRITGTPVLGQLMLSGVNVSNNTDVSVADINSGNLVYVAPTYQATPTLDNISFQVHDGTEYSSGTHSVLFDISQAPQDNNDNPIDEYIPPVESTQDPNDEEENNNEERVEETEKDAENETEQNKTVLENKTEKIEKEKRQESIVDEIAKEAIVAVSLNSSSDNSTTNLLVEMEYYYDNQSYNFSQSSYEIDGVNQLQKTKDIEQRWTEKIKMMLLNQGVFNNLDDSFARLSEELDSSEDSYSNVMSTEVKLSTATLSALSATWVLRSGSIFASFVSVLPVWKGLDMLPILSGAKYCYDKYQKDEVDELFDDVSSNEE